MLNTLLIFLGKFIFKISNLLNLGSGSTWPGHVALLGNKNFVKELIQKNKKLKIVLIAGTNGKTTTAKLIQTILEKTGKKVFQNKAGANLLNGIASTLLLHSNEICAISYDYAIFEIDENSLPLILNELTPNYIILLNLFRDQLDRYGEVDSIAKKWKKSLNVIAGPRSGEAILTTLILNADDPQIANLGLSLSHSQSDFRSEPRFNRGERSEKSYFSISYFGLNGHTRCGIEWTHPVWTAETTDSTYCPNCGSKLKYKTIYFSHLGDWECAKCGLKKPKTDLSNSSYYPLPGTYNMYNVHAALLFGKINNIDKLIIEQSLKKFKPAFGRQEDLKADGKNIKIFLSKNPTSFNESLRTIKELDAKNILFVLNDQIPDGRDISWIWDVNFEELINKDTNIIVSGDRCHDMALRLKYIFSKSQILNLKSQNQNLKLKIFENLKEAINEALKQTQLDKTLYILPTYSAMLEVRKILTGKKIL
ncbi:DUF1727 domain-containing protein [Candidatus Microgenomates bacterium]|nr:MAG: DUF1727 domain-containing protein [Candidatus Microgenomates bacterium]